MGRTPRLCAGRQVEQPDPSSEHLLKMLAVEPVDTVATFASDRDDLGLLEHAEVTGRRRPAVTEAGSQIPGRQLGSEVGEEENDVATCLVGQSAEDALD